MDFSLVPIAENKFLNFIYIGLASNGRSLIALFNTRGNTMIKESVADSLEITYIDDDYIDEKKTYRRAYLSDLLIGGLSLKKVPVLVAKDIAFDLGHDELGNTNDCDMVLGWNIISQFAWRGDFSLGKFEVQTSDFKDQIGKKTNQPIININFADSIKKAAIDTSRPLTIISKAIADEIIETNPDIKETINLLGDTRDDIAFINGFAFENDGKEVRIKSCQIEKDLDGKDIEIVFGADLLRATKWSIYGPMNYVRFENL